MTIIPRHGKHYAMESVRFKGGTLLRYAVGETREAARETLKSMSVYVNDGVTPKVADNIIAWVFLSLFLIIFTLLVIWTDATNRQIEPRPRAATVASGVVGVLAAKPDRVLRSQVRGVFRNIRSSSGPQQT